MSDAAFQQDAPRQRPVLRMLMLLLIAFLAGLAAMAWMLAQWPTGARRLGLVEEPRRIFVRAPAPPQIAVAPGDVPARIAQLEQRLTRVDRISREAVGNADRAEGLLVAFAARRALDRGVALGYIEGLLRERFVATQRPHVATVITAARFPVTLEQLRGGLAALGPNLTAAGPSEDWWTATRRELGSLITIRRAGTTSTIPTERLTRAEDAMDAGQVDVALAEVLRLPGQQRAAAWIGQARRYVAARRALDAIETAALLDPAREPIEPAPPPTVVVTTPPPPPSA